MDLGRCSDRDGDLIDSIIETPLMHSALSTTILLRSPSRTSDPRILDL